MLKFVIGIAVSENNIVLIRKDRPAWQAGRINFPGGKIEQNETVLHCMSREFKEETGVETEPLEWKILGTISRNVGKPEHQFLAYVCYSENEKFNH